MRLYCMTVPDMLEGIEGLRLLITSDRRIARRWTRKYKLKFKVVQ